MSAVPRLSVRDLTVAFGQTRVLDGLSFDVEHGEFVSILGPSGSGKSTLLSVLTGSVRPDSGEVAYDGAVTTGFEPQNFAFMPQTDTLLPWRRVLDNAALGLEIGGMPRRAARVVVDPLFAEFGIDGTQRMWPRELSGGMRQRVALLRTVAQDKKVLLLDEPLGALDAITRSDLQQWIAEVWERNHWTVVLVTHDIREAVLLSDRVLVLSQKPASIVADLRIAREGPRTDTFAFTPEAIVIEAQLHAALKNTTARPTPRSTR